ncbi:FMN-binding negative transcriptional regulator [Tahibacter amnicola]|uniref:FMN-binding negative transcriptional regulator n=1 Tax=Tahibacter amnicola TaxID=2976241 RepID=A0ABY6BK61_9GAMM|nr:FMN-binding negative transcriptional regulator [Tahibacter amnicola]UXI68981.1 FMN-binding negative transcriptional regulator [Tahibacter amnicola]
MRTTPLFTPPPDDIANLIRTWPLALLVSTGDAGYAATPLPLLLEHDAQGNAFLLGHFARSNPQLDALARSPRAIAIFLGPHGYLSPSWLRDRSQAPTWNFATVQMQVEVATDPSPAAALDAVRRLTDQVERGRTEAWSPDELGERLHRLLPAIIAFRARVLHTAATFKLGQNERADVLADFLAALDGDPLQAPLARMMRAANARRLASRVDGDRPHRAIDSSGNRA